MKIAVLSDARLPTAPGFPGHGLGRIALAMAEGLAARGHAVTLFAGKGSAFAHGTLHVAEDEREFLRHDLTAFDAVLDNSHTHVTSQIDGLPAAQISHDREHRPTANAVFPSEAHRRYHRVPPERARIIPHGVRAPDWDPLEKGRGYAAFIGAFLRHKGAVMAVQAARLYGIPLYMAGPTPPAPPAGARYVGPLTGEHRWRFLHEADVLLFPASTESAGLVPLEAAAVGCPSVVSAYGGAPEQIADGVSGYTARDTLEMVERMAAAIALNRTLCADWARRERSEARMIDAYEQLALALASGERW